MQRLLIDSVISFGRLLRRVTILSALLGCEKSAPVTGGDSEPKAPLVHHVIVAIDSARLTKGSRATAQALAFDRLGYVIEGKSAQWSVNVPGVVELAAAGTVVATEAGTVALRATVDGVVGEAEVTVLPPRRVALVAVVAPKSVISVGESVSFSAFVYDSIGGTLTGRPVVWSLEGQQGAAVIAEGELRALTPGAVTLVATVEGIRGEFPLSIIGRPSGGTVSAVLVALASLTLRSGDTLSARAQALDIAGNEVVASAPAWQSSDPAVAEVSPSGLVTAHAPGSASILASIDGVIGSRAITVIDSATVALTLPAQPQLLTFTQPAVTGHQWVVHAGDNLQSVLNSAKRGDEIVLPAGVTFSGNFTLPAKAGDLNTGWITIRSDKSAQLPGLGTRVTSANEALMPKLVTTNNQPSLATAIGARGWWITGVEFTVSPAFTGTQGGIVELGLGGAPQLALADVASDLVLDRVYIHGQTTTNTQRCLELNSARTQVSDSYLVECHGRGFDSQAIVGWNGPGPFKIVNNTLAGAGENVMFGGADPSIPNLIPSDIEIRGNYIYTPVSWKGTWSKKNLFETKNAQRVLLEGNVLDGSWTDAQIGFAVLLKSENQSGRCTWCASRDITLRYNIIRNAGGGLNLSGKEGGSPYPVGELLTRVLLEHNVVEQINVGAYAGSGRMIQLLNNLRDVTIKSNTLTTTGDQNSIIVMGTQPAVTGFDFRSNAFTLGQYGIFSSVNGVGESALKDALGAVTFSGNVAIGPKVNGYPRVQFAASLSAAQGLGAGANRVGLNAATAGVVIP